MLNERCGDWCDGRKVVASTGGGPAMLFEQIASGGCQSYFVGCAEKCVAALIDPELNQLDRYRGWLAQHGMRLLFVIDTHTHADHFSACRHLGQTLGVPIVMHHESAAPFADMRVDDGDTLIVGNLRLHALHTPGHTRDSMCWQVNNHLFTGDTVLFGATGRTDLPTGDAEALYDSLFNRVLRLDPAIVIHPAHDYKSQGVPRASTIGAELATNPRLQVKDREHFVAMMRQLDLAAPQHLTEALRTNMSGGKTVQQLLNEAAAKTPFMSMEQLHRRLTKGTAPLVLDVRERDAFDSGHIPGAHHLPRGQLELRINAELPDPTVHIVTVCEFGKISTLAAATLREFGFRHAVALDGGMAGWRERGFPIAPGTSPGTPMASANTRC